MAKRGASAPGPAAGAPPTGPMSKPLPYGRTVSLSSFAFLFAEMVSYYRGRVSGLGDLEAK